MSARVTGGVEMPQSTPLAEGAAAQLVEARTLMEEALRLLDEAGASADVGAHLDLAICRLTREIEHDN